MARSRDFSCVGAMTGVGAARRDEEGPSSSGLASGRRSEGHVPPRRRAACVSGSSLCAFLGTCLLFASMASGSSGGGTAALRQKSCWGGKSAAMPSAAGGCMSGFELQGKRASAASAEGGGTMDREGGVLRLRGGKVGGVKAKDLWDKTMGDLNGMEEELRTELMSLRVAQQVGGQPGRVNRIKMVRKSIARVLTVQTAKKRGAQFKKIAKDKRKPLDARPNRHMPKAMRQRLTPHQLSKMSGRARRGLASKVWMGGVRPESKVNPEYVSYVAKAMMRHPEPGQTQFYGKFAAFVSHEGPEPQPKRRKRDGRGAKTDTGHIPEHAKTSMARKAADRKAEIARVKKFKASRIEDE